VLGIGWYAFGNYRHGIGILNARPARWCAFLASVRRFAQRIAQGFVCDFLVTAQRWPFGLLDCLRRIIRDDHA